MTPTLEEVKRVAIECGMFRPDGTLMTVRADVLQAFAQHWIEVGEKKRRDNVTKSAKEVECTFHHMCPTRDCNLMCEDRITSNNTGEYNMQGQEEKWKPDENMIESGDGVHAICLNKQSQYVNWIFYKHPAGNWVTLRRALPQEIEQAKAHLNFLKYLSGEPCKP